MKRGKNFEMKILKFRNFLHNYLIYIIKDTTIKII